MTAPTRRAVLLGLAAAGAASAAAQPVSAATRRRLVVIGDSWAAGLFADPRHALGQVAAAALGWRSHVDAVSGSGYLNPADRDAAYPTRARRATGSPSDAVVVVQGGGNDWYRDLDALPAAAARTIALLREAYPAAHLLLLGPGPDPWPVTAEQHRVDHLLQVAAGRHRVPYVSMMQRGWITSANLHRVIDPANDHPTRAGQRYLGTRLAHAIADAFPGVAHLA